MGNVAKVLAYRITYNNKRSMRTEIIEILQKAYPEYCLKHIDTANEILRLYNVMPSLPSHIDSSIEAKHYGDEMNKLAENPNRFHELDFYNGTVWIRQMIKGKEA